MEVTPARESVRPGKRRRASNGRRSGPRGDDFAQEYERLVDEVLGTCSDDELDGGASGARVFFRINAEGLPEAAVIFDSETGRTMQKLRFPLLGGEAA
jgi:hypothetical protein